MKYKKLKIARKKIDKLDKKLFELIKKRTDIIVYMLALKKYRKEIVDKKRINEILKNIEKQSIKSKIDTKVTRKIWKSMIWAYIDFQKKNFRFSKKNK